MEKPFQRELETLQPAQKLDRQHGQADGTDQQRETEEYQAVGDGASQHDGQGQQAEDCTGDPEQKRGMGEDRGAQADEQREQQRDRRSEEL